MALEIYIEMFHYREQLSVASQKNRLLAVVLIMTGCPQATLRDGEGRNAFVEVLKQALVSNDIEVSKKYI